MKFYFILFVCTFLFKSNNHLTQRAWPCNVQKVYTLIEDKVSQKDTHWLRLFDVPGSKRCVLKNIFELLDSAYRCAIPLEFTYFKQKILGVRFLGNTEESKYLSAFKGVRFFEWSQLAPNLDGHLLRNIADSKTFHYYLTQQFKHLNFKNLSIGCEARAGIIGKYLNDQGTLYHYKIFINGQLKLKTKNADYAWAHHVLNLIPLKQRDSIQYYVFDPFILGNLYPFDTFLEQLKNSGSGRFCYRITDANVLVCLMHKPMGIYDQQDYYSRTIFQQLYQP